MNCRDERTPRRRARWLNKLYLLGAAVLLSGGLSAQVNYSYGWEPTGLGGWTGGGSRFTGATVCSGSAAVRRNLYSGVTTWDFVSPALGTSQGGLTTLTFNYKAAVWSANTVGVPAGAFTMNVQWGTSASGPWTTLGTIDGSNHVSSGSCAPGPGTYTFTPADGEAVYVRFQNAWVSGDYYLNFDDVVVVEQLPTCSGTVAPGATTGPSSVCADVAFDVGVTNTTPGDQVVYSWERSTTDGTSGFATFGAANAPTVNVTQAVPTWYRCTVTCNGLDPLTSSVLSVGMNAAQDCYCDGIVMGFDIEPICRVIFAGIDNSSCSGVNCDGDLVDYTGSVAPAEVAKGLSYPMTVTGNTAGNYTNNVTVYVDWDGNGTFESANTIGSFVNQTCPSGAGVTGNLPVPLTAATGITRMRVYKHFGAAPADACTSVGFGQAEDYLLNVSEPPSCLFPSGFSAVPATGSTATLSWTEPSPAPAIGYDWEIRSSGAPFSADPGLVEFGSIGAGNTSLVTPGGALSIGATYTAYIRSDCDGETSDPVSATLAMIYCTAGATDPGFEKIVRVQFADVDNPSSSTAGYEDFSGISANVGTDVAIPFTITLNESYTSDRVLIWVDLNNNLVLTDPGELVYSQTGDFSGLTHSGSFTIPGGTSTGAHRMRIRLHDSSFGANSAPCGTSTYGQVEDYTVTICPDYEPVGTPVDNCVAQTFDVSVSVPGLGDGVGTILYTVDGGTLQSAPYVSPSTSLTGFSVGQIVDATLDVGGCTYTIGSIESACVQELDCEATSPVVKAHCYTSGDTKTWWFSTDGPTIELKFNAGVLDVNDQIEVVDGDPSNAFANVETVFIEGDLTGQVWTSYGQEMGIRFVTDGSGSCAENSLTPIEFQVRCTGCQEPAGTASVEPTPNCVNGTFRVNAFITSTGFDVNTGSAPPTAGVQYTLNGGTPQFVGDFAAFTPIVVGDFPLGSLVNVTLLHFDQAGQSVCNNTVATGLTLAANCPPINDLCTNPTSLTVQANCTGNGVSGTTENATSTETPSCDSDGPWYDVWYIFNSGDFISHNINFTPGTIEDWGFELFTTCGAPVVDGCGGFGGTNLILPTLAANTNYRLKVFTNDAFGAPGDFQICISGTPLTPGERCDNAIPIGVAASIGACSPTTVTSGVQQNGPAGCTAGVEDDRWFSFVAPSNGNKLVLSTTAGTITDWAMQVWSGCPGSGMELVCNDDAAPGTLMPEIQLCQFEYTPGATYYVRLWTWSTISTGTCSLCIYEDTPCPPPPANNACVDAQALTMNAASDCPANQVAGTTISATAAANGNPNCDLFGTLNDVWYTVTTGSSQTTLRVDLSNVSGNHEAAVYSNFTCGTNGAGATQVACFTAGGTQNVTVLPSTVYHIRVWANPGNQGDFNICVSAPAFTCTTDLSIDWVVPGLSSTPLWELRDASNNFLVASGGGQGVITGGIYPEATCVPDGDFRFLVLNGSSMRYVLRTAGNPGTRLIDNQSPVSGAHSVAEFSTSPAALSSSGTIQSPVGPTELLFTSCDKYFWKKGEFVVVNEDPDVAAVWIPGAGTNQSSTTGYDFWFYDPNGTYSFIRQRRHNVTDGFGNVGSARTCHMQVNNWATANWIPNQLPLNVRVRAVVENVPKNWGPACRFVRDDALANCTPTWLMDVPGNPFISCNTIRAFNNQSINRVYARPVSGATKYEFTFNTAEGPIVREVTTYYVTLGWNASVAPPLGDEEVYDVTVRAFKGGVWCEAGKSCTVQICNTPTSCTNNVNGGTQNSALDAVEGASLNMWPNPNRGDQLFVSLSAVEEGVETISMDIFDLSGKRITARTIATQGGYVNTVVDLNGDIAAGLYMVNITAGGQVYTQRLVIQP